MPSRLGDRLTFTVERLLLRGVRYRLLVIAAAIGLISIVGGALVYAADSEFTSIADAVWWAFLRLTDPGYLGDDVGALRRTISTILTILGYVVFLGALIAVMTQWLNSTIRNLERGLTPIAQRGHVLILGWTDRTPTIVRELVLSEERVQRFLQRHGARRLRIVILVEQASPQHVQELREALGRHWDERQVILRSGSPLRLEHLRRVDFENAAAIILPGADFHQGGRSEADTVAADTHGGDTGTIKALLSITNHSGSRTPEEMPLAVAEIFDARKLAIARRAYGGRAAILASDSIISRLIAQNVRHRGLSHLYNELLTHSHGNEIYVRDAAPLAGRRFDEVRRAATEAIPIGVLRVALDAADPQPLLKPPADFTFEAGDRVILIARSFDDADPPATRDGGAAPPTPRAVSHPAHRTASRVLLLGWSHRVPALVAEFQAYRQASFSVDILSALPIEERTAQFLRYGVDPASVGVRQLHGDYTVPSDLSRLDVASYDNIVLLGSSWVESRADSDARTIFGYLLLRELLPPAHRTELLVELMDPANLALFRDRPGEVLISPQLLSHMLAQVALRPELGAVFDELFGSSGGEIMFYSAADYGLVGTPVTFADVQEVVAWEGATALGVRLHRDAARAGGLRINPPRSLPLELTGDDEVVVLVADLHEEPAMRGPDRGLDTTEAVS